MVLFITLFKLRVNHACNLTYDIFFYPFDKSLFPLNDSMYGTCRYSVRVDVIFAFSNLRRNIAKRIRNLI